MLCVCVCVCVCVWRGQGGSIPLQLRLSDVHKDLLSQSIWHHVQHLLFREQRSNGIERFEEAPDTQD